MENTKIYDSKDFQNEYVSGVVKEVALILEERGYNPFYANKFANIYTLYKVTLFSTNCQVPASILIHNSYIS